MKNISKALSSGLKHLFSSFTLGIVITLIYGFIAFQYYQMLHFSSPKHSQNPLFKALQIIDQKSVDFRLQQRGPRRPSPDVALIAVDEQAVNSIGRWPWPREVIGQVIERVVELGAKVIAFDAVFSEDSLNTTEELLSVLKNGNYLTADGLKKLHEESVKRNSDKILSESIGKNADHVVLGTFFDSNNPALKWATYPNRCFNFIYETTSSFKIWDNDAFSPTVFDQLDIYMPPVMSEIYKQHLNAIAEEITNSFGEIKNYSQSHLLEQKIHQAQLNYCSVWLDPEKDVLYSTLEESWPLILKEEDTSSFPFNTFSEFVESFKSRYIRNMVTVADNWVMNTPLISKNAQHTGYFNAQLDEDGTIRRSRLVVRSGEHYMPSIALKAYLVANHYVAGIELTEDPKLRTKVINKLSIKTDEDEFVFDIPVDKEGGLLINYAGPQKMFPYLSVAELLSDSDHMKVNQTVWDKKKKKWLINHIYDVEKKEWLKGKLLVFGATATGIYDLRVTPFDENFPGAETHLNVIDNLVRKDFLKHHSDEDLKMVLTLCVLGIIFTIIISKLGALLGLTITGLTLIAVFLIDKYFIFGDGIVISIVHPLLLISLLYVSLTFYKYFTEERNKRELRSTFQKYVSPAIVEEVLSDPEKIELGGRKAQMTVFFSDVRGFTTISEKLDPRSLSDLLNSYLTPMTEIVFKNRGTLDKYMGDAIMAFFGAPIFYPDHAKYACRTALEHIEKLKELQIEYKRKGLPPIDIGIGLNTGEMSVGNMGSETVRNYTVMGDAVNLGSRLEGINKQYGTRIIISEFTYADVSKDFTCRELDWVRVKGKALPVKIFELIKEGQLKDEKIIEMLKYYSEGYNLYHEMKWDKAKLMFEKSLEFNNEDSVSKLYVQRCEDFLKDSPGDEWDGVFVMKTK